MNFDIADPSQHDQILSSQAMLTYGVPTVFPDSPNLPAYRNKGNYIVNFARLFLTLHLAMPNGKL